MTFLKNCRAIRWASRRHRSSESGADSLKAYSPIIEERLCKKWEKESSSPKPVHPSPMFSTLLPPPNVTGTLHLGHALTVTIGDVLCRWHRMRGSNVLWLPGTDHAGIATQVVVEKDLKSRNLTRHDLGREKFIDEVWKWRDVKGRRITDQLCRLGASLDWSKEYFTLDEVRSKAVIHALIQLWDVGLVYRAESLVSWCCHLRSAISDIEVSHMSLDGPTALNLPGYSEPITFGQLDFFAYCVENSEEEVVVATTRLETMLGDVAVAVHPSDVRYTRLHGKLLVHPFNGTRLPVVVDESVDPKFGTGAVKVTPAHDQTDFEIGKRHGLDMRGVILEDGTMNDDCGQFSRMKRFEARDAVKKALESLGLFKKVQPHKTVVPICSRSGDVIELLLKPQWFIKCDEMAARALTAVQTGKLIIEPDKYHKAWSSWLEKSWDWCISRQLWWGHQVPFYRCTNGTDDVWVAAVSSEDALVKASKSLQGEIQVERDADVLDTWFSSGLLPFSCFGWPDEKPDSNAYPMSILVTGHDILFFWVARMTMLGLQLTNQLPFKKVLLHSIVCDGQGRKMSKSLGNIIDPLDVMNGCSLKELNSKIADSQKCGIISMEESFKAQKLNEQLYPNGIPECGADALRFTLLCQNVKNHYMNFSVNECYGSKLFCNKIWQAHKFAHLWHNKLGLKDERSSAAPASQEIIDQWILSRLSSMVTTVNRGLSESDFFESTAALRSFLYGDLCDVYIESVKPFLNSGAHQASTSCKLLLYCFDVALRCLAPFMPFVSETLYSSLANRSYHSLDTASFPADLQLQNIEVENKVAVALEVVHFIRKLKSDCGTNYKKAKVFISTDRQDDLLDSLPIVNALTKSECILKPKTYRHDGTPEDLVLTGDVDSSTRVIVLPESITRKPSLSDDVARKRRRKIESEMEKLRKMMSHESYHIKASEKSKKSHESKMIRLKAELDRLT